MKKILLYLSFTIFAFTQLEAQSNCLTCKQGKHNGVNYSATNNTPAKIGDGSGTLGQTYLNQNVCGLNYVQASVLIETRSVTAGFNTNGTGNPTTLTISGLPCGGNSSILQAYLYYEASYTEATPPASTVTFTNPVPATSTVSSTLIGQGGSKCWGETGTAAYRADVTLAISGNGNYTATINGFTDAGAEVDGATLIIVYKDPNATYSGSIVLYDGINTVAAAISLSQTFTGFNSCDASNTADAFGLFGDMQSNVNTGINTETFNGSSATFNNLFWNFDDIPTTMTAAQTTTTFNTYTNNPSGGDCYAWILAGLYWQNTTCMTCTPTTTMTLTTTQVNPTCGNSNGSATVTVTGGNAPYTYLWSPGGQTTATATGLSAGTYTVTVTDNSGCVPATITVTLVPTGGPTVTGIVTANDPCNGSSIGIATVTATGGTTPYTYLWTPGGYTTATVNTLSAGTYTITVTDNNGCTGTTTITITQPPPINITTTFTATTCGNNNNGAASASASGGNAPYTYLWNPGGGTTQTITGLSAGTYTVTVTDNNNCSNTASVTVTATPSPTVTVSSETDAKCNGNSDGTATVTVSGGTAPYTYLWNPGGGTNPTESGLSAGTYTITVTDASGCTASTTVTISQPNQLITVMSQTTATCGNSNGTATVTVSGGTVPYTYLWNPSAQTTPTATGLSGGSYTVTVTDNNGCTATNSITVTSTPSPTVTVSSTTGEICNGGATGSGTVAASGGTAPYTYLWLPGGGTNPTETGLSAGTYTVTVTDANGCSATTLVTITQPSAISTLMSQTPTGCTTNSGTATVTASGGTAPYTYLWNPSGQTTPTATGLSAGLYTVTVTDNNGCQVTDTITVKTNTTLSITVSGTDILCNGGNTGTATVTASGGTSPYTYLWTPGGGTTNTITGLSAGTYTISVTDNGGCSQTATVTITEPQALSLTTTTTGAGCQDNAGTATVKVTGGTAPYTYLWNPGGGTTAAITGIGSGTYTITVTDANGCTATTTTVVSSVGGVGGSITSITNVACFGNNNGSATVTITSGTKPYTYLWSPGGQTTATATGLSAGTYTITVLDSNGCTFTATATITGPLSPLAETHIITNSSCNSTNNGSIALTVTGGTPQYTYSWSNGATTQNLSNLLPGSFTVTIKDSNGCTLVDSMKVGFDSSVVANAGKDTILCHNSTITLNGLGSKNATSYQWFQMPGMVLIKDTSVVTVTPTNDTTTYILVVENGLCFDTSSITVILAPAVFADAGPDQVIVGSGTVTIGGSPTGPPGSSYYWMPPMTLNDSIIPNPAATPTVTTIYTVVVKNSAGCIAIDTVTIFVEAGVVVPNGFTPNADGVNDTWVLPFAGEYPNIVVEVYNRWGELLFQSTGYYTPWDGTYQGKPLPIGTYYYVVKLNDPRYPNALTGPLTLMR